MTLDRAKTERKAEEPAGKAKKVKRPRRVIVEEDEEAEEEGIDV